VITVKVDTPSEEPPPIPPEVVTSLVTAILTENGIDTGQVQVVFTSDEHLRRLQRQFFGQDHYTDVISFHLNEAGEPLDGEIYISQECALENSRHYHEPYHRELMRLVVHGSLHLSGYEDRTPENQAHMRTLEDRFLASAAKPSRP
jgi:probable rRNA maturation factor